MNKSMFGFKSFSSPKCLVQLKLAITRLRIEEQKHAGARREARKKVAEQLRMNNISKSLILVEDVLSEEVCARGLRGLASFCTQVEVALKSDVLDKGSRPAELDEALATIIYAANAWSRKELQDVAPLLKLKCGRALVTRDRVNQQIAECFEVKAFSVAAKLECLESIAKEEGLPPPTYEAPGPPPTADGSSFSSISTPAAGPRTPPSSAGSSNHSSGTFYRASNEPSSLVLPSAAAPGSYFPPLAAPGHWSSELRSSPKSATTHEEGSSRSRRPSSSLSQFKREGSKALEREDQAQGAGTSGCHEPQPLDIGAARHYTLAQLLAFTRQWRQQIGRGGFGDVFYGQLEDGRHVAVKRRKAQARGPDDDEDTQFLNEVMILSRCRHKHLVNLLGFCFEGGEQILVYEYAANGTLVDHLFPNGKRPPQRPPQHLSWHRRLKILLGSAQALQYLHHEVHRNDALIHRDVKASNILLDDTFEALLADFGLTKAVAGAADGRGEETLIKGTVGYLDPEYFVRYEVTIKSDVYSFGVLMLVVIAGREAIDEARIPITQYAKSYLETGDAMGILDSRLVGTPLCQQSVQGAADLARDCIVFEGEARPLMKSVVRRLEDALEQEETYQKRNQNNGSS